MNLINVKETLTKYGVLFLVFISSTLTCTRAVIFRPSSPTVLRDQRLTNKHKIAMNHDSLIFMYYNGFTACVRSGPWQRQRFALGQS